MPVGAGTLRTLAPVAVNPLGPAQVYVTGPTPGSEAL